MPSNERSQRITADLVQAISKTQRENTQNGKGYTARSLFRLTGTNVRATFRDQGGVMRNGVLVLLMIVIALSTPAQDAVPQIACVGVQRVLIPCDWGTCHQSVYVDQCIGYDTLRECRGEPSPMPRICCGAEIAQPTVGICRTPAFQELVSLLVDAPFTPLYSGGCKRLAQSSTVTESQK